MCVLGQPAAIGPFSILLDVVQWAQHVELPRPAPEWTPHSPLSTNPTPPCHSPYPSVPSSHPSQHGEESQVSSFPDCNHNIPSVAQCSRFDAQATGRLGFVSSPPQHARCPRKGVAGAHNCIKIESLARALGQVLFNIGSSKIDPRIYHSNSPETDFQTPENGGYPQWRRLTISYTKATSQGIAVLLPFIGPSQ